MEYTVRARVIKLRGKTRANINSEPFNFRVLGKTKKKKNNAMCELNLPLNSSIPPP